MKDIKVIRKMKFYRNGKNLILNWLNFFLIGSDLRFEGVFIFKGVFDL